MTHALRAELRKLRYTRSLWLLPAAGIAINVVGATVLICAFKQAEIAAELSAHGPLRFGPTNVGLVLLLFGARLFGDESHHRTLPSTFVRMPHRRAVLVAKAAVGAAVAVGVCVAIYALVLPITVVGVGVRDLPMAMDAGPTAALFGREVFAMTLTALLGVSIGAAIRNRAVALVGILVWLMLAEDLLALLLRTDRYMPSAVVQAIVSGGGPGQVTAPTAALVLAAFVATAFATAAAGLDRDAG